MQVKILMNQPFAPSCKHFQKDLVRYLKSQGKYEKNEYGQTVFYGNYDAALDGMFRHYLAAAAFTPLVDEFGNWNWEWVYNDYLLQLSDQLRSNGEWTLLKRLWGKVIAKRRTNYNDTRKVHSAVPEKVSEEDVAKTRELLLDALHRLRDYATDLQQQSDIGEYLEMIERVANRCKA